MNDLAIQRFVGSKQQAYEASASSRAVRRFLRAKKMSTVRSTMDEFAAALQFPWYFGSNRDAFDECMKDLSWLQPFSYMTIIVYDANNLLVDEIDERAWLLDTLTEISIYHADATNSALRVVLQETSASDVWLTNLPVLRQF